MHLELETSCIYYWRLLHIARESYHRRQLELNYSPPPAKSDFKPLLERVHETQQKGGKCCTGKETRTKLREPAKPPPLQPGALPSGAAGAAASARPASAQRQLKEPQKRQFLPVFPPSDQAKPNLRGGTAESALTPAIPKLVTYRAGEHFRGSRARCGVKQEQVLMSRCLQARRSVCAHLKRPRTDTGVTHAILLESCAPPALLRGHGVVGRDRHPPASVRPKGWQQLCALCRRAGLLQEGTAEGLEDPGALKANGAEEADRYF